MIAKRNHLLRVLALLLSAFCCSVVYASTQGHTKSWNTAIITGPLTSDRTFLYYFQPQLNFIDDTYRFETMMLLAGAGYSPRPDLTFWLLDGWYVEKRLSGDMRHLNSIGQQVDWLILESPNRWSSRSRLEERANLDKPGWQIRFRQRIRAEFPFKHWESHSLVLFDEAFVDFTHPTWLNSNSFFEQNRAFIGVGTQLTKQTSFDIGYLNQVLVKNDHNELSNMLYLVFIINL